MRLPPPATPGPRPPRSATSAASCATPPEPSSPASTVTVNDTGTGATHTATTDADGHYAVNFLQPGTYEVLAGGTGSFGKIDRKNVPVTVGAPITIDVVLPTADVTSTVTVTSEAPLVDTEKVEESQVIGQNLVSNLPVASRRFETFVLLTPNVVPDGKPA